ncbi:MAG: PEP-CTERM sorting domain-containing protein [Planctomycetota bacterium]
MRFQLTALLGAIAITGASSAATTDIGYTIGSGLLGADVLVDGASHAGLGTFDLRANDTGNGAGAYGWVAVWDDLWNIGDDVSLTGIAVPVRSPNTGTANNTGNGTWTFTFYELTAGDTSDWNGTTNGEAVLGTATATFDDAGTGGAIIPYFTFDSSIDFTAASTGIAVHFGSTSSIRTRWDDGADGVDGVHESRADGSIINNGPRGHQWTIAGTAVIPEPGSLALLALGGIACLRRRRG